MRRSRLVAWTLSLGLAASVPAWADAEPAAPAKLTPADISIVSEVEDATELTETPAPAPRKSTPAKPSTLKSTAAADSMSKDEVEKIVADYLKKKSEADKKTAADEAKAKADEWYTIGSVKEMKAEWNHGLEIFTPNKDFRIHVGGRTQWDNTWFNPSNQVQFGSPGVANVNNASGNAVGAIRDGSDFRRGRLRVDGTFYDTMEFCVEYDFFNTVNFEPFSTNNDRPLQTNRISNTPVPTELWFQFNNLPYVGTLRFGNMKDAIGLEHLMSSRFLDFVERSYNQDAFYSPFNNGFAPGGQLSNTMFEERGTWTFGAFRNNTLTNQGYVLDNQAYMFCGRVTALPVYVQDGLGLVHVGASYEHRINSGDLNRGVPMTRKRVRGSLRPGVASSWYILGDTGNIVSENEDLINFELTTGMGPWNVMAEYLINAVNNAHVPLLGTATTDATRAGTYVGTAWFHGGYIQTSYFLTGEHREYSRKAAVWERIIPAENAFVTKSKDCPWMFGRGAWQALARADYLNLSNSHFNGGVLYDYTLGLNWFLNPNMKMQFNVDWQYRDATAIGGTNSGWVQGFGMRIAHDF